MIAAVDWSRPWFGPWRAWGERLPPGLPVPDALNALSADRPRFVPQAELPEGAAYETFIDRTGQVPTRENLHDLFNGLVWRGQTPLKRQLNRLQADEIERHGIGPRRGPVRDALTLFDEFGALWRDPPAPLVDALRRRDWLALFVTHRDAWVAHEPVVFGHALLEQLAVTPRKSLTAHVALGDPMAWSRSDWASKPFMPMPLLGLPGWCAGNDDPTFYTDKQVFRALRGLNGAQGP